MSDVQLLAIGHPADALAFACEVARRAGAIVREIHLAGPRQITSKKTIVDLVTEADVASERLIIDAIRAAYPDHAIYAEESSGGHDFAALCQAHDAVWMVDPVDGTTNFAHGIPVFGISIALQWRGALAVGVIFDPARQVIYWAEAGQGAWCDGRPMQVSKAAALNRSVLATGFSYDRATNPDNNTREIAELVPRVQGIRRMGSACLDLAFVADGRMDGYWEARLHPWDWGAGVLMVREAGGHVTDYEGKVWQPGMGTCIASNGLIHVALSGCIRTARQQPLPRLPDML
jgi:myo-inositol-1(or 4)-monophosphatase